MSIHSKTFLLLLLLGCLCCGTSAVLQAQDIIVLHNGDLIKAKVTEVGLSTLHYKRSDQTDGPGYIIAKSEVFSIHYADGSKDILGHLNPVTAQLNKGYESLLSDTVQQPDFDYFMKKRTVLRFGMGLFKVYSPSGEIGVTKYKARLPFVNIDLGLGITTNFVVGVSYGWGNYTASESFEDQFKYSRTTFDIAESIKSFGVWGRYYLRTRSQDLRAYGTLGLAMNSSRVKNILTTSTGGQNIVFNRGGNLIDFFPITRIGVEMDIRKATVYSEVGYGVTLINFGLGYSF